MKTAHFQYECRQCGEIFEGPATGESRALSILIAASASRDTGPGVLVPLIGTHGCNPEDPLHRDQGVADLIGYRVRED